MIMKTMKNLMRSLSVILFLALVLAGCGLNIDENSSVGEVDVDVTDAPSLEYDHVYITVTKVAFHESSDAGSNSSGWQTMDISANPVTIDLVQLADGKLYADTSAKNKPLFSGLLLPAGTYRQLRIYLASTEDPLTTSARALNLTYNNQATYTGETENLPVRIPNSVEGIKLVPETPLVVTDQGYVRLALDFNLSDDMMEVYPSGLTECVLKPRLKVFDMDAVGAITGKVSFANLSTSHIVVMAQQRKDPFDPNNTTGKNYRVVRRTTAVDTKTGIFNLYPLPIFGNNTTADYDILIRGRHAQTTVIKGVKIHRGTNLRTGAVNMGQIDMIQGDDFTAQLPAAGMRPRGAWVNFYQTVGGDPVPFEVYSRHLDPYTGMFAEPVELSASAVRVATFDNRSGTAGPFTSDSTSRGSFTAIAAALLFTPGTGVNVTGAAESSVTFAPDSLTPLSGANSITARFTVPAALLAPPGLTKGYLYITYGGLVIDCHDLDALIATGGGSFTVPGLPGGTAATPLAGAYYGVNILGWGSGTFASGSQLHIDLSTGNGTADITMK